MGSNGIVNNIQGVAGDGLTMKQLNTFRNMSISNKGGGNTHNGRAFATERLQGVLYEQQEHGDKMGHQRISVLV